MLTVLVTCSNHQKNDGTFGKEIEVIIDSIDDAGRRHLQGVLERRGWVVQFNGDNMDTYCSRECAK